MLINKPKSVGKVIIECFELKISHKIDILSKQMKK